MLVPIKMTLPSQQRNMFPFMDVITKSQIPSCLAIEALGLFTTFKVSRCYVYNVMDFRFRIRISTTKYDLFYDNVVQASSSAPYYSVGTYYLTPAQVPVSLSAKA